ncbi:phage portal protein [Clostridium perfringens]|uniref:phage portal protein n=1 Tax=Clostridium perfringens TaxID=1502 RepID=UPI000F8ECB2C|nr:phage portal protein [Clostridium perfringens]EHA6441887.1 phage portal protein [Clostridium perfringens]MDU1018259.1 phage portal protein [Clostridium perfringens]RUR35145.1 phage portal protein [Clostridium perfringens]
MFFRNSVRKNRIRNETKTISLDDPRILEFLGIENSENIKEATYYTCMKIRTDTMSKIPVKLYKDSENGVEKLKTHYLYSLLKLRPNPYMSASDFWGAIEYSVLDTGRSIVYIDVEKGGRNAGKVKGLYPLKTSDIQIWIDNAGIVKRNAMFYLWNNNGVEVKLDPEEVLDFKGMTLDGIHTLAIKDYLKCIIENAKNGQSYVNNFFKNGLFAKGIIQYTGDLNEDGQKLIADRFISAAAGTKKLGGVIPMPIGMQFIPTNVKMADAQFLEINQLSIKQIASGFGVKMHQLNDLTKSTHTNIEQQQLQYYIDTLMPALTRYEQELTYKLLSQEEVSEDCYFRFNPDVILRADYASKIEGICKLVNNGLYKPDEGRNELGLPKAEGGDRLVMNGNYIPLTMVGEQYKGGGNDE